jgi:hypothetical protein
MDNSDINNNLDKLLEDINAMKPSSRQELINTREKNNATKQKLQENLNKLQETLDFLSLCVKYQRFDLEATRRENDYLRKLLEEKNN